MPEAAACKSPSRRCAEALLPLSSVRPAHNTTADLLREGGLAPLNKLQHNCTRN